MVKIRLRRTGTKKRASFRIVVAPSRAPRDGRFLEILGHYNPRHDPPTVVVNEERLFHWMSQGAQLTDSLKRILISKGILDSSGKKPEAEAPVVEEPAAEAEAAA